MSYFLATPRQRIAIMTALKKGGEFASDDEFKTLTKAAYFLKKNGCIYENEIKIAMIINKRVKLQENKSKFTIYLNKLKNIVRSCRITNLK